MWNKYYIISKINYIINSYHTLYNLFSESQTIDESDDFAMEDVVKKRWDLISDSAKTLILKMISKDPTERPNFYIIFLY